MIFANTQADSNDTDADETEEKEEVCSSRHSFTNAQRMSS